MSAHEIDIHDALKSCITWLLISLSGIWHQQCDSLTMSDKTGEMVNVTSSGWQTEIYDVSLQNPYVKVGHSSSENI
jgi:hypothetical protein